MTLHDGPANRAPAVALELDALGKVYNDKWAVSDLSLRVEPGTLVALLGPSGCGKTTTLRMIAGLIEPDAGDVRFDGASVVRVPPERRGAVMVFQQPTLFSHLDIAANVGFGLRMRREARSVIDARVAAALEQVQLSGFGCRRVGQLSGGQQQRVALARALVTDPRVWLLDEPLSSLDPSLRDEMRDLIARLHTEKGITTLIVTHDRQEAMTLADRIAFLSDGRLQQYASAPELYERPTTAAVARFFGMANLFPATIANGIADTALGSLRLADRAHSGSRCIVGIRPEHIRLCGDVNAVSGRVVARTYLGQNQQVTLRTNGGTDLMILLPPDAPLSPADDLTVSLPPERLRVIADPPAVQGSAG